MGEFPAVKINHRQPEHLVAEMFTKKIFDFPMRFFAEFHIKKPLKLTAIVRFMFQTNYFEFQVASLPILINGLHSFVIRSAAALGRDPVDDLIRVGDVAGLAVNAV